MHLLIIDTETANSLETPMPYDIGYAIYDTEAEAIILERSFMVTEMFFDHKDLLATAYYAEKIPTYWEDWKEGSRKLAAIREIKRIIAEDMKAYDVHYVGAYNMGFDKRSTNNGTRYLTQSFYRWFFPFGTEFFCIWAMACDRLLYSQTYVDYAFENDLVSESGKNISTNAQSAYRFITDNADFAEEHKGLEDVRIEVAVLAECLRKGTELLPPNFGCWRKVADFAHSVWEFGNEADEGEA